MKRNSIHFRAGDLRPAGPTAASAACREGGAMRRPEGTRRERSGGGMPPGAVAKQRGK